MLQTAVGQVDERASGPKLSRLDTTATAMSAQQNIHTLHEHSLSGASADSRNSQISIQLMVSMFYLKHAFNESDESLVERWSENVVRQFCSGQAYCQARLPCDAA